MCASKWFRLRLLIPGVFLALGGCVDSSSSSPTEPDDADQQINLSGSVGDGPIIGAAMVATSADQRILAEFESTMQASYSVSLEATAAEFPIVVAATGGTDLVTNLPPDFDLSGAVLAPGAAVTANVNPFTTFAVEAAAHLPGGATATNIANAEGLVVAGLDTGLATFATQGTLATPVDETNIAEIVRASEALAEIVRRTRDRLGVPAAEVITALAADVTDGVVDGRGAPQTDPRIAAVSSLIAAQVLLETMTNTLEVNGANALSAMEDAILQVSDEPPQPGLQDLSATSRMLTRSRIGLGAAWSITADVGIVELAQALDRLPAGASASLARITLPADFSARLDAAIALAASGDAGIVDTVNSVVRNGGTDIVPDNAPPQITGDPPVTVGVDEPYAFVPDAEDPDGDALTFSIENQPPWAAFDAATGSLSGTPGSSDVGSWLDILITVSDGQQSASIGPFTVNVVGDNAPPDITGAGGATVEAGEPYAFQPMASDPDGDPLTFTITNQPAWTSFDSATGRLSGTPTVADEGAYTRIIIRVTDGELTSSLAAFSITVTVPNSPPTIGGTPAAQVNAGSSYSFTPVASDADGDALTFSITGRPAWASFSQSTGRLSGTPDNGDAGDYTNIRISVTDGVASATLGPFSIAVTASNSAPTISGSPPSSVNVNTPYSFTPAANDADGDTLTFTISGMPGWASFNASSGALSGSPDAADVGVYNNIRITVSDGNASATLGPFSVTVVAVSNGSATLSWSAPTENTDGSALTDLAGFRLYWRNSGAGAYTNSVTIDNPGVTTYMIENLAPGTYDFVATAFNSAAVESTFSSAITHTVE